MRATIAPTTNALTSPRFGRLYGPDGTPLTDNSSRDAEDLVVLADGRIVVSLERQHRLWLYPAPATADEPLFKAAPHAIPLPPDFPAAVSHNAGIEAMTQLADGRLVILTEGQSGADHSALWVSRDAAWDTDPAWHRHDLRINAGYHPTAIAELANGDLVVLERRFILPLGLSNRLRRISRDSLNNDQPAPLDGPVILSLDRPPVSDNFEGLASQPTGPGATTLHMISDNNYTSLQRTLMVSLSLADTP